jgi:hypothetical protein
MNKKILAAAIAATCAIGALHTEADAADKAKNQTIGDLSCLAYQVAEFDGEFWNCIDTPSGGGSGAPEYQFMDDNGIILGDVVYIEDAFTAWGYINDLSETSTIQVTATFDKTGRSGTKLDGNVKASRVWYESNVCSGLGYLADYEADLSFWVQGVSEPSPYPPFLAFLETAPVYYLPDDLIAPTTWTEMILSENTGVYDFESYNLTSDIINCEQGSLQDISATQIDSFGFPIDAPAMPIFVVEK